jgi:translocation and assembly module TamB
MKVRRVLKRIGIVVGAILGGLVIVVAAAIGALHTSWGGERLRGFVVPKINENIAGRLEVGQLALHGVGLTLDDVTLYDPEGLVVARIGRLDAAVAVRPLLSGNVDITKVLIERPVIDLVHSPRGLNLARAITPGEAKTEPEKPAAPSGEPTRLELALRRLHISDGVVSYRDLRPEGGDPVRVEGLDIKAQGQLALPAQRFAGQVAIDARARQPLDAPVALRLKGAGEGMAADANLSLTVADGRVVLRARSEGETTQTLFVHDVSIPPGLVKAFVPSAPLLATVALNGQVARRGDDVKADLRLVAAETRGKIVADLDVARLLVRAFAIDIEGIDVSQLVEGGPPSAVALHVRGEGGGRSLETLTGKLNVDVPAGQLGGRPVGPVRIAAAADRGNYALSALDVALPGVSLTGRGQGTAKTLTFEARLVARDLALLAKSARLPRSLRLAGHGQLAINLGGRPDALAANVKGAFPSLRVAGNQVTRLALDVKAANLQQAPAGASVNLAVKNLRSGSTEVSDLRLTLDSPATAPLRLAVSMNKPMPLSLTAGGRVSPKAERIDLTSLTLDYPQVSWRLAAPARITIKDGDLVVDDFALAAGSQRVAVDLEQRRNRIKAVAVLDAIDLARVPSVVLPPGTKLAGRIDARVEASGNSARPDANVTLKLVDGRFGKFTDLALALSAQHRRGRVAGELTANALAAQHRVNFDVPVVWPPPADAALKLEAKLGEIDLAQVAALSATAPATGPPKFKGRFAADLAVSGVAGDPALALKATASGLEAGGDRLDDVRVTLTDPVGRPLVLEAATTVLGRKSNLRVETPAVLGRWLRRPPKNDELLATPFTVKAEVDRLPLAPLGGRTARGTTYGGSVSARAALQGPMTELRGTLDVDAVDVRAPRVPPTSATLRTRLGRGREGIDTVLKVSRKGLSVADLTAKLGVGVEDLIERRALAGAPIKVVGRVGPITLQRRAAGGGGIGRRTGEPLNAQVGANLAVDGTLGDPKVDARVDVIDARLGAQPLGTASAKVAYKDAKPHLELRVASARGGGLDVTADAKVDLSLPALMKGLVVAEIPIDAKLRARALDLFFLSGLDENVRSVEGKLEADATLNGRVGAPQMVGRLGWQNGRVVLAGFGEIRDIALVARGDQREMVLERLFARAGNGTANLSAQAVRQPDGRQLKVEARAKLDRFRVQTEGQPLGSVSLDARADGTVAPDRIAIATEIEEAQLDLAGGDRRKLQSLSRPDDVVIFADGQPANRRQARRYDEILERQRVVTQKAAAEAQAPGVAVPVRDDKSAVRGDALVARKNADPISGLPTAEAAAARSAAKARPESPTDTRITVTAPRNLWVRGPDVNIELGLDPDFVINTTGEPRIFGTVRVRRGFVVVLGRRFDVESDSSVRFQGLPELPVLSVDASHRADNAEATVKVHIEGPADAIKFTLRSPEHPEWGDSELLSVIATGRAPDEPGNSTTPGQQAKSLLGGLLADRLQKTLTSRLPIDVLVIEPGDNLLGTTLEAGTYFGDDVYVAYVGRLSEDPLGRENRNEVHLEYQLTSRWSFEATYGDARRGSADLLWTRHY